MNDEPDIKRAIIGDDGELLKADTSVEYTDNVLLREPTNDPLLSDVPYRAPSNFPLLNVLLVVIGVSTAIIVLVGVTAGLTLEQSTTVSRWGFAATAAAQIAHPLPGEFADAIRTSASTDTAIQSCQWSPDGNRLAVGNYAGATRIWNAVDGSQFLALAETTYGQLAWSPDGGRLVTSVDRNLIIWDTETGERLRMIDSARNWDEIAWSLDGMMLATTDRRSQEILTIYDAQTGVSIQTFDLAGLVNPEPVLGVVWVQGGLFALTSHNIVRWDTATWEYETFQQLQPDGNTPSDYWVDIAVSDDRRYVAVSKDSDNRDLIGVEIYVWDTIPNSQSASVTPRLGSYPLRGTLSAFNDISWSPDNARFATTSTTSIFIWDATTGELLRILPFGETITDTDWSSDNVHLAACSHEFVRIYSLE